MVVLTEVSVRVQTQQIMPDEKEFTFFVFILQIEKILRVKHDNAFYSLQYQYNFIINKLKGEHWSKMIFYPNEKGTILSIFAYFIMHLS